MQNHRYNHYKNKDIKSMKKTQIKSECHKRIHKQRAERKQYKKRTLIIHKNFHYNSHKFHWTDRWVHTINRKANDINGHRKEVRR